MTRIWLLLVSLFIAWLLRTRRRLVVVVKDYDVVVGSKDTAEAEEFLEKVLRAQRSSLHARHLNRLSVF